MSRRTVSCLPPRRGLAIALGALLVTLAFYFLAPDWFELAELRLLDLRTRIRGPVAPDARVKLILIDARSRNDFGMNEDMRTELTRALDELCHSGVAAIGLDLFFVSVGDNDDPTRAKLADAVAQCRNVVMGFTWEENPVTARLARAEAIGRRRLLDAARNPEEEGFVPGTLPADVIKPDREIMRHAAAVGYFTVVTDPVNIARKIPATLTPDGEHYFSPFSLAVLRTYLQQRDYGLDAEGNGRARGPVLGNIDLRPDESGYLWLNPYGAAESFETVSLRQIARAGLPADFAKDAIVLVGVSGEGSNDMFATTFDPRLPRRVSPRDRDFQRAHRTVSLARRRRARHRGGDHGLRGAVARRPGSTARRAGRDGAGTAARAHPLDRVRPNPANAGTLDSVRLPDAPDPRNAYPPAGGPALRRGEALRRIAARPDVI
ncbi:MAG: CHASE2 domain-containing protein [Deltaproteobacteria bacterium]|nr:CHASE2 domain-containing protein [Deltaproteobacteria bacterium]